MLRLKLSRHTATLPVLPVIHYSQKYVKGNNYIICCIVVRTSSKTLRGEGSSECYKCWYTENCNRNAIYKHLPWLENKGAKDPLKLLYAKILQNYFMNIDDIL